MLVVEKLTNKEDVYDFEVADPHCFFANDILVHNCEISLKNMQFCNLTEINASDIVSQEDFNKRAKVAAFIGTLQSGYTDFHYLRPEWKENTDKDALLGCGLTGIASGTILDLDVEQAAKCAVDENVRVAGIIGTNVSARVTTVKPSGTSSLTVGSSSGIHAWHNDYYIRRMRVGKTEALYKYMSLNFPSLIEDCKFKPHIEAVMSFPQKAPEGAITRNESVFDLLERVKRFNLQWIKPGYREGSNQHNVSCTISIKDGEWDSVGEWMWENKDTYTGISVLPYDNGTYIQAPFEDCDKETFERMYKSLHDINLDNVMEETDNTNLNDQAACAGGACTVI